MLAGDLVLTARITTKRNSPIVRMTGNVSCSLKLGYVKTSIDRKKRRTE